MSSLPCECGCGVMLAQKAKGSPRRFFSDMCQRRATRHERKDEAEERAYVAERARMVRAGEVLVTPRVLLAPEERAKQRTAYQRDYWLKNKDRLLAQRKQHAAANPRANAEWHRKYYATHRDRILFRARRRRASAAEAA